MTEGRRPPAPPRRRRRVRAHRPRAAESEPARGPVRRPLRLLLPRARLSRPRGGPRIFRRRDAIFPATVVGKPRQEDFFIGDYLQDLLSPLFPLVMPSVVDLWSYGDTGFHSLAAAVVRDRYGREAMASAFRILGRRAALAHEVPARDGRSGATCSDFRGLSRRTSSRAAGSRRTSSSSATSRWTPSTTRARR